MSVYAAIDLHSNNNVLAVLDENDRVLRQRRLPNELPAVRRQHAYLTLTREAGGFCLLDRSGEMASPSFLP